MSVEDRKIIDLIGTEENGTIVLTISDHLEWDDEHLIKLQYKINDYLAFIESGEILESYPSAKSKKLRISVVCKHDPNTEGLAFFKNCAEIIWEAGYKFSYEVSA